MKRYKEFIKEMWLSPEHAVKLNAKDMSTAQPAVMHKKTKEVIIGKRGELHFELPERSKKTPKSEPSDWHRGFWHEKKKFVNDPNHEKGDAADFVKKKTGRYPSEAKITKAKIWNSKRKVYSAKDIANKINKERGAKIQEGKMAAAIGVGASMLALGMQAGIPAAADEKGRPIMQHVHAQRMLQINKQKAVNKKFANIQYLVKKSKEK